MAETGCAVAHCPTPFARAVLGADAAAIYLAEEGDHLVLGATSGGTPGGDGGAPLAFGESFAGRVAATRRPMLAEAPDAMIQRITAKAAPGEMKRNFPSGRSGAKA